VWEMVATGHARGVHHIESPAMTSLEKMCGCRDIDTLVAIVSVIRPGAANTLRKAAFARRAKGLEEAVYAHPCLEPVLRSTHGVVAYEEHVLQIADVFAGMSPGRADVLRRALSKMRDGEVRAMRGEFFECARAAGRGEDEIVAVWALVEGFRGYAFCRAHSTAYALEAWEAAWMKRWWPAEFLAAVLTHGKGFYSRLVYTLECRRLGIGFLPPDVNRSSDGFFVEECGMIRVPLAVIGGLGVGAAGRIGKARGAGRFRSLDDFVERTGTEADGLEALLRAGALDGLVGSRAGGVWEVRRVARCGAMAFGGGGAPAGLVEPTRLERLRDEMEVMGFTVCGHPLELWPDVAWETYCPLGELDGMPGRRVVVCGLVVAERTHHQVDGRLMKFMTVCDWSGMVETEMFAGAFQRFGSVVSGHPVLELEGVVVPFEGGGGCSLRVERVGRPRTMGKHGVARTRAKGIVGLDGGRPLRAGREARGGEESPDTTRRHAA
jgi:DNA polymerase III alpha subunit